MQRRLSGNLSTWRLKLDATVEIRREANRRMVEAITAGNPVAYRVAEEMHDYGARLGRSFGMSA